MNFTNREASLLAHLKNGQVPEYRIYILYSVGKFTVQLLTQSMYLWSLLSVALFIRMPKSNWSAYKKYYSAKWESEPLLKEWICSVPGDRTRAACRLCHLTIRAHHGDLVKHANTATHKRYVEGRSSNAARFLKAAGANAVARKRQENDQKITDLKISVYIACHTWHFHKCSWSHRRKH